jgi:hypothetical protein
MERQDQTSIGRPKSLETYRPGARVTVEEIYRILGDDGYSAGHRTQWLKTLLTDISISDCTNVPEHAKAKLIAEVEHIIESRPQAPEA